MSNAPNRRMCFAKMCFAKMCFALPAGMIPPAGAWAGLPPRRRRGGMQPAAGFGVASPARRGGFTLVELTVSLAIASMILLACGSAVMLASRSIEANPGSGGPARAAEARAAVDQVVDDLRVATTLNEKTAKRVVVTVPDRTGDGLSETVRYEWSGVAGEPLTRRFNADPEVAVAGDVHAFDLTYLFKTVGSPPEAAPAVESAEKILASYNPPSASYSKADGALTPGMQYAAYFTPSFGVTGSRVVSWKITRVTIWGIQARGAADTVAVEVRNAGSAMKPLATSLESKTVSESAFGSNSFTAVQTFYATTAGLDPSSGMCLVVRQTTGGATAGGIAFHGNAYSSGSAGMASTNSGSSWSTPSNNVHLRFEVRGTVTTERQ